MMERLTRRAPNGMAFVDSERRDGIWHEAEEKLAAYEEAEEQGRLVMLPCKVDTNAKKCCSCSWSGVHSLKTYGVWRCDYHGFYADGNVPNNIHCKEWRKDYTALPTP